VPTRVRPVPAPIRSEGSSSSEILRFRRSERHLHWAIAIPFIVCYTTALLLVVVYNPDPGRPFRSAVSWIHRLSGICLAVLPPWTIARHWDDLGVFRHNLREAWVWTRADLKWLALMGPATFNGSISLPHQGKFNAAEKINFMVLTATYPLYVLTGLLIWLPGVAYLSWLVHFSLAVVATPLILGHVFMATLNPDTRIGLAGMITGFVDRRWARHHYRRWYDEQFGTSAEAAKAAVVPEPPRPAALPIRCPSCETEHPQAAWVRLRDGVLGAALLACTDCGAVLDAVHGSAVPRDAGQVLREIRPGGALTVGWERAERSSPVSGGVTARRPAPRAPGAGRRVSDTASS